MKAEIIKLRSNYPQYFGMVLICNVLNLISNQRITAIFA